MRITGMKTPSEVAAAIADSDDAHGNGGSMKLMTRLFVAAALALVLCPLMSVAEDYSYRGRVFGGVGGGRFYDDEGSLGRGVTYRAGAEWRPLTRLGIEAELLGIHHTRHDYFQVRGNGLSISANALFYFSRSKVQPYVLGGIGMLKTDYRYSWPGTANGEFHRSETEPALNLGAGIRFFINRRWSLDPQIRTAVSSPSYYAIVNYFSMSLGYHW
jgi:opacity protein-like surface antigen